MKVRIISTKYIHWGSYSGITQLPKYIDNNRFQIEHYQASDSNDDFNIKNEKIRKRCKEFIDKRGMEWYKLSDLVAEYKALWQILTGRLDILHYLDSEHSAQFVPIIKKKLGLNKTKIMGTFHQPIGVIEKLVRPDVISSMDLITVVSPEQIDFFKQFIEEDRIKLILHGANVDFFKPSAIKEKSDKFRCITVGHWQRDFEIISEVVEMLENNDKIEFIFITSKKAFPQNTGLEDRSNARLYRDGISDEELLELYQDSDVLFLPLLASTANNAIIEAISCGLPVISSDLLSVKAYLTGDEALLISGRDPDSYMRAIVNLAGKPEKVKRMSTIARTRAEELDWKVISEQYIDLYSNLTINN